MTRFSRRRPKPASKRKSRAVRRRKPAGPSRAVGLPQVTTRTLRYRTTLVETATTNPKFYTFGFVEPLARVPGYMSEMFALYSTARITGAHVKVTGNNLGSSSLEIVLGIAPANWSPAFPELVEKRGVVSKLVSAKGGLDRFVLNQSHTAKEVIGAEFQLADYDFNLAQASSTSPLVAEEPLWVLGFRTMTGNVAMESQVIIDYHVTFFDLVPPS